MGELADDGTADFSLGMDGWHKPDRIQPNQIARGINLSTRSGSLSPRNGFDLLEQTFDDVEISTDYHHSRKVSDIWKTGKFQALLPLKLGNEEYLITLISGLVFKTNVRTAKTICLSTEVKCSQYNPRIHWSYGSDKPILHDYPDYPLIIDGDKVRRSDPKKNEVPISVLGTYNHNRLFVASEGVEFDASDSVGNSDTPDAPLTFIESQTPSSAFFNQTYSLNIEEAIYPITAMGFLPEQDSSTGVGQMFISSEQKLYFYRTNQPRAGWQQSQFGGVLLNNNDIAGQRAHVLVNSDLLFMNKAGHIHALSTARNDAQRWGNVPISREVEEFVKFQEKGLVKYAVLGYVDNYVFITVNPYRVTAFDRSGRAVTDYAHGGFVVLELESLASFLSQGTPTWSGLWTGVNPVDVATIGNTLYILSKDGSGSSAHNALYRLNGLTFDRMEGGRKRQVRSIIYTREYDFKNNLQPKKESTVTLSIGDIKGKLAVDIERKSSTSSSWLKQGSWTHEAVTTTEEMPPDALLYGLAPHQIKPLIFGDAEENGHNVLTADSLNNFYKMQYRITLTGDYWLIDAFKTQATVEPMVERRDDFLNSELPRVAIPLQPELDWICPM